MGSSGGTAPARAHCSGSWPGLSGPTAAGWSPGSRTSTLLQLGVGFNPELSGSRNIYLGGLAAGLRKARIDEIFEDIVEYAELEEAIDRPIKTYSSGCLETAFSIGMTSSPTSSSSTRSSALAMSRSRRRVSWRCRSYSTGRAPSSSFSHSLSKVAEFCDRALWLEHGQVKEVGESSAVVEVYREAVVGAR